MLQLQKKKSCLRQSAAGAAPDPSGAVPKQTRGHAALQHGVFDRVRWRKNFFEKVHESDNYRAANT